MFKYVAFYALSIIFLSFGAARATENCDQYTVMPGDTLRLIAEQYYGARGFSPIIYNANTGLIGPDPNTIEIGMELAIPCRDDMQIPMATGFLTVVEPTEVPQVLPRFLTKSGGSPFLEQDGSGIIPDILAAALRKSGYQYGIEIDNSGAARQLLNTAATDYAAILSFPWILPDCTQSSSLSDISRELCRDFSFSKPLYEITLGLFARAGDPLVSTSSASDFAGKTICVPRFHNDDLLRRSGIFSVVDSVIYQPGFDSCMAGLLTEKFDVIMADYQSLNTFYDPRTESIADIAAFSQKTTIHAIAFRQNPDAMRVLELVDSGLEEILASGEWFGIVTRYLNNRNN